MKTSIIISGQISGNFTLKNALDSRELLEEKSLMFNNFELVYATKKAAKKALWEAFKYLRSTLDEPRVGSMSGLRYSKFGSLYYDASKAELQ